MTDDTEAVKLLRELRDGSRIELYCVACGTQFVRPTWLLNHKPLKFCSVRCSKRTTDRRDYDADFAARFWQKVKVGEKSECWDWMGHINDDGYGRCTRRRRRENAHRVAYELHRGESPVDLHVLHSCDRPRCCNPHHLWLGTHQDNMSDMVAKGRSRVPVGEECVRRKLNEQDILAIRSSGLSAKDIAAEYGINRNYVYRIRNRENWRCAP